MPRTGPTGSGDKSGPPSSYANPFRKATVAPERTDMGVDYQGQAGDPIYAIAPGKITEYDNAWSGAVGAPTPGAFFTEKITRGPAKGQTWYYAEDINPSPNIHVGSRVNKNTIIGTFTGQGQSESGWAVGPNAPGETKAAQYGQQAPGRDPGAWSTAFGISANELLASLGAKPAKPGPGHGKLPKGWYPSGKLPSGGGNNNPTQKATLTSFFGDIKSAGQLFGLLSNADFWERVGLVLLGAILIIVGIIILALPAGERAIRDIAGIKRSATSLGLGGGDSGPSPEVQADKERRLSLAEANTKIGERKIAVAESKESRLALGKPAQKRHKSGNPEPNPAPTHS